VLRAYRGSTEWLAVRLAAAFSSMEAFFAFTVLVMIPFIWPKTLLTVTFISSGLLQLIALPLIGVSGVIVGRAQDLRAAKDHKALMYEVRTMRGLFARQEQLIKALHEKLEIDIEIDVEPEPGDPGDD
jgi:hypothetical protein